MLIFFAWHLATAARSEEPARARERPNILFAISDDQSYPHAGILGDPVAKTPAFDRAAREGVLFTHSFAACPSCTPSRSAILTGRQIWQICFSVQVSATVADVRFHGYDSRVLVERRLSRYSGIPIARGTTPNSDSNFAYSRLL